MTGRVDQLDFDASLLLSERHAACQATQRSVRDIQERLAAMVRLHSRAQPDSGEKTDDSPTQVSESSDSHADAPQR